MAVADEFRLRMGALLAEATRACRRSWLPLLLLAPVACLPIAATYQLYALIGSGPDQSARWLELLAGNWLWYCGEIAAVQIWTVGVARGVLARARRQRGLPAAQPVPRALTRGLATGGLCLFRIASNIVLLWLPGVVQVVRLFVAVPVAVGEGLPARAAALRSAQLVRGSGMRVFALLLLLRIVRTVLVTVSTFLAVAAMQEQRLRHLALYGWLYLLL